MTETDVGTEVPPQVQIATVHRDASGRLVVLDILPEPTGPEDKVLVWSAETNRPMWADPADLGFSAIPMLLDVAVTDGSGAILTDGFGAQIVANLPYRGT